MKKILIMSILLSIVLLLALAGCSGAAAPSSQPLSQPPAATQVQAPSPTEAQPVNLDGKALTEARCTTCHGINRITRLKQSAEQWKALVEKMVSKGAELNAEEQAAVIKYLSETFK